MNTNTLELMERNQEAEKLLQELLAVQQRVLSNEHPEVLTITSNLATVMMEQGRNREAEKTFRELLTVQQRVLGMEHVNVQTSIFHLTSIMNSEQRYEEAERMLRTVLESQKNALGSEHSQTLSSMFYLALMMRNQQKYAEAEEVLREVLTCKETMLGKEHVDILTVMISLAELVRKQRRNYEAERMLREVLPRQERVLGKEHDSTLTSMFDLALVLRDQRRYQDAEEILRGVLAVQERLLGEKHPKTRQTRDALELALRDQRKEGEADELSETIRYRHLSSAYWSQGRIHYAEPQTTDKSMLPSTQQGTSILSLLSSILRPFKSYFGRVFGSAIDSVMHLGEIFLGGLTDGLIINWNLWHSYCEFDHYSLPEHSTRPEEAFILKPTKLGHIRYEPYLYANLPQISESNLPVIRLVELMPIQQAADNPSTNDVICCKIISVELDQTMEFEALSYAWGSTDADFPVVILDIEEPANTSKRKSIKVTPTLYAALKRLRYIDRPRLLWIDQLCINQCKAETKLVETCRHLVLKAQTEGEALMKEAREAFGSASMILETATKEKNSQVKLMADLYRSAKKTIVWLGDDGNDGSLRNTFVNGNLCKSPPCGKP